LSDRRSVFTWYLILFARSYVSTVQNEKLTSLELLELQNEISVLNAILEGRKTNTSKQTNKTV